MRSLCRRCRRYATGPEKSSCVPLTSIASEDSTLGSFQSSVSKIKPRLGEKSPQILGGMRSAIRNKAADVMSSRKDLKSAQQEGQLHSPVRKSLTQPSQPINDTSQRRKGKAYNKSVCFGPSPFFAESASGPPTSAPSSN